MTVDGSSHSERRHKIRGSVSLLSGRQHESPTPCAHAQTQSCCETFTFEIHSPSRRERKSATPSTSCQSKGCMIIIRKFLPLVLLMLGVSLSMVSLLAQPAVNKLTMLR